MKKKFFGLVAIAMSLMLAFSSCGTDNPTPNNPQEKTITVDDLAKHYFIVRKTIGKELATIYFVNDGGLKGYYDVRGARRINTPVLEQVNAEAGTAVFKYDIDNNGVDVLMFTLSKNNGTLSLTSTTLRGSAANISMARMEKVADLSSFSYANATFVRNFTENGANKTETYTFPGTMAKRAIGGGGLAFFWEQPYYAFSGNVGFKVESKDMMGVVYKTNNGYSMLTDLAGVISEF